jgi:3-deoxy-D-manno-octulosonate 8-phosphate phosphatase (KDO 8-P phosphatase)
MNIELLILDVDGVLTDGTKVYNINHEVVSKRYLCKDFTAIKRIIAAGVNVIMISGDNFNESMAKKRNIDFFCSRGADLSLDKSRFLDLFEKKYQVPREKMAFVGDDYFDLSMFKSLKTTFCPCDAPLVIRENASYVLNSRGGDGAIVELYDLLFKLGCLNEATEEEVASLDRLQASSKEMS